MLDPSLRRSAQKVGTQKVGTQKVQRDTKFIYFNPATPRTSNSMFSSKSQTATFTAYHHTALHFEAKKFAAMPTLVWVRRPESAPNAAAREGSATRREAAVPDPVVSAAAAAVPDGATTSVSIVHADPVYVAFPAVSTKRPADGVEKKKRKSAEAVTDANKKSKATSERDLPTGVRKLRSGKYESRITWGDKTHYNGAEAASAARKKSKATSERGLPIGILGVHKRSLDRHPTKGPGSRGKRGSYRCRLCGEAKANHDCSALEPCDVLVQEDRKTQTETVFADEKISLGSGIRVIAVSTRTPRTEAKSDAEILGACKTSSGKFQSLIWWGKKRRYIGSFNTPEQASAAFMSVRNERDIVELSVLGADEVDALFEAAKKKALKAVGESKATSKRDLPQGVHSRKSPGKFVSTISWGNKVRYIGTFDTPEQASAAHLSVMKDRDVVELSALGADEVDTLFDAAKTRALKTLT